MSEAALRVLGGRYEVGPLLGRGAMGDVRAATDRVLGREVAVKLLRADLRHDPAAHDRFIAEARAAAALAHPNVVAVHDAGEDDGDTFLVMERLSGRTLADDLARGPLPAHQACDVVLGVLAGLEAAHRAGIVHRDVKPGNVMWTDDGRVKVGDFGIATSSASELTRTGEVVGTPAYLAPERVLGERATPRSDVFAVGVLLFHALSGVTPFPGDTPISVAFAISQGRARRLADLVPDLPPALVAVVERAMAHDPDRRYGSARAMAAALDRVRAGVVASEPGSSSDRESPSSGDATVAMPAPFAAAPRSPRASAAFATTLVAPAATDPDPTRAVPSAAPDTEATVVPATVDAPIRESRLRRAALALGVLGAVLLLAAVLAWATSADPATTRTDEQPVPTTGAPVTSAPATTAPAPAHVPLSPPPAAADDDSDGRGRPSGGDDDDGDDGDEDGDDRPRGPGNNRGRGNESGRD